MGDFTSPDDEALFGSIGRLVISCAHMELAIDAIVHSYFHRLGNPANEKEAPNALTRKIKYIKRSLSRSGLPGELLKRWRLVLSEIEKVNEDRNDVIHGSITEHEEGSGTATFARRKLGTNKFEASIRTLNAGDITLIAIRAQKLSSHLSRAALGLDEFYRTQRRQAE